MKWPYRSSKSQAKNQTVPIDAQDKRLSNQKRGITRGRIGAEVEVINGALDPIVYGSYITSGGGSSNPTPPDTPPPVDITVNLGPVKNLVATWNNTDDSIDFTFDFDLNDPDYPDNKYATGFRVTLDAGNGLLGDSATGLFLITNPATVNHVYNLKYETHIQILGGFFPPLEQFCVSATDKVNVSIGPKTCVVPTGYQTGLECAEIEVSAAKDGYLVTVLNDDQMLLNKFGTFEVWEVISNATTAPTTGYVRKWQQPVSPALIPALDLADRWVKGRFLNNAGISDCWSTAYKVTPIPGQGVDTLPPNNITVNSVAWSGDNININYTLPATEKPYQLEIVLESSGNSGAPVYRIPTSPTSNSPQDTIIFKSDIAQRFSQPYPSSFTGMIYGIDTNGNKNITGVSFNVPAKTNPLSGITPTFTTIATSNGYTVSFDLPSGATRGEVYQKYTSWSGITSAIDYFSGTYQSGGSIGTNTVTISGVVDNHGNTLSSLPTGYLVNATGLTSDTFISAVSGSAGTFTLTFSKYNSSGTLVASNFSVQSSGTITAESLVHSGSSPVTIPSTIYANTYIVIKYYGEFAGYESLLSAQQTVVPLNPAIVDNTVPNAPTVASSSVTSSTITLNLSTTDTTTKGYRLRYKKSTETLYTTEIVAPISSFVSGTSTTTWTIKDLNPNIQYNISAAGYNQYNGVGSYSADTNISTSAVTVSTVSNLQVTEKTYGVYASWTAASNTPTKIAKYKVELYNSSNTLLATDYTFGTNILFSGLSASTTYYVKTYAQDIYDNFGAAVTSSNITLSAAAGTSDGLKPSTNPTPTLTPVNNSLYAIWTPVSNIDPVTYEVHLSTINNFTIISNPLTANITNATWSSITNLVTYTAVNTYVSGQAVKITGSSNTAYNISGTIVSAGASNFTVSLTTNPGTFTGSATASVTTKVFETTSSAALLRVLPGTLTPLSYGTTYYVKILAKDIDGAFVGSPVQASSQTAQIATTDITNGSITGSLIAGTTITASNIANGAITTTQIAPQTITASNIANATITSTQIGANTITSGNIAANTITASNIAANTITASQIAANTITASKIAANTITAGQIAADTITAAQIAAGAVTASEIAANTITAGQIAAGTITATQIASATITSSLIASNTILAGNIAAGTITSGQIDVNNLLVGSRFVVGGKTYYISTVSTSAGIVTYTTTSTHNFVAGDLVTVAGLTPTGYNGNFTVLSSPAPTGTTFAVTNSTTGAASGTGRVSYTPLNSIVIDTTGKGTAASPFKLYSGVGTYKDATTPFYFDSAGQFSLKDRLHFDGNTTLTVNGTINALAGDFQGALTINGGTSKIGKDAGGTGNHGLFINANNYWYTTGNFKVGSATNGIGWDGTSFDVTGSLNAQRGTFTGPILMGSNSYIQLGTSYSISAVSGNGTTITYTTSSAHQFSTGQIVTITGIVPSVYNLTNATIASATPGQTTFTVTNSATGTYQYGGTAMAVSGNVARVQIAPTAISVYDANNTLTTQIVGNAAGGANTFTTTKALIGDWTVSSNKIESTLVTGITKYTGLSASNTAYAFWAGATSAANSDNTAPFSVTPYGAVIAKNITIAPSIGSYTGVTASGTGTVMTYTTSSAHNLMVGQSVAVSGMSISGYNISGTIQSVPTTTTFTLSGTATGAGTGGTVKVNVISSANFTVDSTGTMSAQNAVIIGNITANTGTFTGNVFMDGTVSGGVAGSLYAATNRTDISGANSTATLTGQGYILNTDGLSFWFGGSRVTYIKNNQSDYVIKNPDGTTATKTGIQAGTLFTKNAWIGNWEVTETEIRNVTTDSNAYGSVYLVAGKGSGAAIYARTGNNEATAGILGPKTNKNTIAFWAGAVTDPTGVDAATLESKQTAFYVTYNGDLYARNAKIQGTLKGGDLNVTSFSPLTATGNGYYFDPLGSFLLGSASGSNIKLISGEISVTVINGGFSIGKSAAAADKAFIFDPDNDQIRIRPKTSSGTNNSGLYLDAFIDDQNYGKNDPQIVRSDGWTKVTGGGEGEAPTSWVKTTNQIGRVVKGRRLYWGFDKTPTQALSELSVAGISDAEAGDFFFSTAIA